MRGVFRRLLTCIALFVAAVALGTAATATLSTEGQVQTTWRLLDYRAVDYREAVVAGRIKNQLEYDEMVEFSSTVTTSFEVLPANPKQAGLLREAKALQSAITAKAVP